MEAYKNPELSISERVEDLISRMTLEEKVAQLSCMAVAHGEIPDMENNLRNGVGEISDNFGQETMELNLATAKKIQEFLTKHTRLGIPALIHSEALQGLAHAGGTIFPAAIGMAASWDPELVVSMGDTIRSQAKAMGARQVLSPVMDVCRDARWGRINETYGESPALCAAMSAAYVKGLQGTDLKDGVVATGKHFLGYGFSEGACNMHECHIPPRRLREVYAKPFQAAITEAGMLGIMNSYNTIDGECVVTSKHLLTDLLRDEMKFEGIVVSDYMSLERVLNPLKGAADIGEAAGRTLNAGLDVECPNFVGYAEPLMELANREPEKWMPLIERSLRRVLTVKFRLGLFEQTFDRDEDIEQNFCNPDFEKRSFDAAGKTLVLVKNEDKRLPLSKSLKKVAVIGPLGDDIRGLFNAYTYPAMVELHASRKPNREGTQLAAEGLISEKITPHSENVIVGEDPCTNDKMKKMYPKTESVLESLKRLYPDITFTYAKGCDILGDDRSGFEEAKEAAKDAEAVICVIGGRNGWGKKNTVGEALDTCKLELTGVQSELIKELYFANPNLVITHLNGRPLTDLFIEDHVKAVLECFCPGPYGAQAIAKTLFGDMNPGGKMPVTTPRYVGQVPVYAEHIHGSGYSKKRGMVLNHEGYFDGTNRPLRYFGQGLSYTEFSYDNLKLEKDSLKAEDTLKFWVNITNTGSVDGEEVVQVYYTDETASVCRPVKELVGFKRVFLKAGETKTVCFEMRLSQIAFLDEEMKWKIEAGKNRISIASSSEDIRLTAEFVIENDGYIDGAKRGFYAKAYVIGG